MPAVADAAATTHIVPNGPVLHASLNCYYQTYIYGTPEGQAGLGHAEVRGGGTRPTRAPPQARDVAAMPPSRGRSDR